MLAGHAGRHLGLELGRKSDDALWGSRATDRAYTSKGERHMQSRCELLLQLGGGKRTPDMNNCERSCSPTEARVPDSVMTRTDAS